MTTIQGDIGTGLDRLGNSVCIIIIIIVIGFTHGVCLSERLGLFFFSSLFFVGTFHIMHIAWSFIIRRRTYRRHTIVILGVFPFFV